MRTADSQRTGSRPEHPVPEQHKHWSRTMNHLRQGQDYWDQQDQLKLCDRHLKQTHKKSGDVQRRTQTHTDVHRRLHRRTQTQEEARGGGGSLHQQPGKTISLKTRTHTRTLSELRVINSSLCLLWDYFSSKTEVVFPHSNRLLSFPRPEGWSGFSPCQVPMLLLSCGPQMETGCRLCILVCVCVCVCVYVCMYACVHNLTYSTSAILHPSYNSLFLTVCASSL